MFEAAKQSVLPPLLCYALFPPANFLSIGALLFSRFTAVRFSNGQEAFPLTTAAQNIHVFLRKSPLCRNHFFGWSKTANSSTAYGTVTLKSPLSRAFAAHHVHPRLRKRLSRCTLDCGFQTSESPALRGFVAERAPIRGTSLYLVIFSNGDISPQNTSKTGINAPEGAMI